MMRSRYCPLCDRGYDQDRCPRHQVPTLPLGEDAPPTSRIGAGTILKERYRIDTLIGRGGMGAVLAGFDLERARPVVIKVLRGAQIRDKGPVRRFYREGRAASELDHPHIVRIHELGFDESTAAPFLVKDRVAGETLERSVERSGPFAERRALHVASQVAEALKSAHSKGILHRDLKPRNVMLEADRADHVTVLDFGLAKGIVDEEDTPPLTEPGRSVGTPAYMSPEQITQAPQDERSDLYGLGCLLHHMLTGRAPYSGPRAMDVMRMHLKAPIAELPSSLSDGKPPSARLLRIHRSLLEKSRSCGRATRSSS